MCVYIEVAMFSAPRWTRVSRLYLECQGTEEEPKHQALEGDVVGQEFEGGEVGHSHLLL